MQAERAVQLTDQAETDRAKNIGVTRNFLTLVTITRVWASPHDFSFHLFSGVVMSLFTTLLGSKLAAGVLAAGVVTAGAAGAAAYANVLPAPLQQSAHEFIGAPAPKTTTTETVLASASPSASPSPSPSVSPSPSPSATAKGPDATGAAAYGLCTAYLHGGLNSSSTAYTSLVTAARGAANITAYCATVPSPGNSAAHRPATSGPTAQSGNQGKLPSQAVTPSSGAQGAPESGTGTSHKPATAGQQ